MLEVASTIVELVGNLLNPAAYLIGVIRNVEGDRRMWPRGQGAPAVVEKGSVQVRIGIVQPGRLPAYRLEAVGTAVDGQDNEVIGVFDGEKHVPLGALDESANSVRWSDAATPVSDVEKVLKILSRFNSAGISSAPRA